MAEQMTQNMTNQTACVVTGKTSQTSQTSQMASHQADRASTSTPNSLLRLLVLCVLVCSSLMLAACGSGSGSDEAAGGAGGDGKPVIVTSIPPLATLIQPLVADWGRVESLLPAGASVHGHDPSSSQMQLASKATALIVVGRNLDGWAQNLVQQAAGKRDVPVITFAQMNDGNKGLNLNVHVHHDDHGHAHEAHDAHDAHDAHEDHDDHAKPAAAPVAKPNASHDAHAGHDHDGLNPHLWLDPVLTRQFIAWLTPQIEDLAPDDDARAATRAASLKLQNELAGLDEQYKKHLGELERKDMVTFHNAFDLLAARYGLNVAAHLTDVELAPGGEVTASQLIDTIKTIRQYKLKVVYAEPQFPERATEVLTQETGASILRLDPLGGRGIKGYETYFEMMDSNLKVLMQGQRIP